MTAAASVCLLADKTHFGLESRILWLPLKVTLSECSRGLAGGEEEKKK